ncbi:MAG: DUF2911 domain-containing protein, partial [Rhodothermales bacterium]|nr:DUF2911 domain-containing protein [Rhodothermales bacterium]
PRRRDRVIFGGLVPYGEVWRTGANEATEITLTRPVRLAGNLVEAGTYALFTVPGRDSWTIILNGVLGQWGAYDYDASADVLRFDVSSASSEEMHEAFTISIEEGPRHASVKMVWENTVVSIPLAPA